MVSVCNYKLLLLTKKNQDIKITNGQQKSIRVFLDNF